MTDRENTRDTDREGAKGRLACGGEGGGTRQTARASDIPIGQSVNTTRALRAANKSRELYIRTNISVMACNTQKQQTSPWERGGGQMVEDKGGGYT